MSKLDDLHTLQRLLKEFEFPVSPILEYAIKEKEEELCAKDIQLACENVQGEEYDTINGIVSLISFSTLKDEFSNYLYRLKSQRTASNYLRYIDKPIRAYINKVIDSNADSIYSFQTSAEAKTVVLKLKAHDSFMADNLKWHNALTAALTSYIKFLEDKEHI